jgi:CRISPR-associated protein Cas6
VSGGDEVVDVVFALRGRAIVLDYADRLWRELRRHLDWLAGEAALGVHPLAGVSAGDTELYLTRRARLTLRLRRDRLSAVAALTGLGMDLGGEVAIGAASQRALTPAKVLYSSFVTVGEVDEQRFLAICRQRLAAAGIAGQLVAGRARRAVGEDGEWRGFSLMLHGLTGENSLRLQREGLGDERVHGCGIFVPHKAVAAVDD